MLRLALEVRLGLRCELWRDILLGLKVVEIRATR